jgi:hypothetical protein
VLLVGLEASKQICNIPKTCFAHCKCKKINLLLKKQSFLYLLVFSMSLSLRISEILNFKRNYCICRCSHHSKKLRLKNNISLTDDFHSNYSRGKILIKTGIPRVYILHMYIQVHAGISKESQENLDKIAFLHHKKSLMHFFIF